MLYKIVSKNISYLTKKSFKKGLTNDFIYAIIIIETIQKTFVIEPKS